MTKQALSYNMIENNFCTSGRRWKTLFHRHQQTNGNTHGGVYLLFLEHGGEKGNDGSWAGVLVRLRKRENRLPLPSTLRADVQSLDNKLDELRCRMAFQWDIKFCNVMVFTETWLDPGLRQLQRGSPFTARTGKKTRGRAREEESYAR